MASETSASSSLMKLKLCSFQFEVDYQKTKDLPIGQYISSPTFTAGGYDWGLRFYPHGMKPEEQSHVSLFLYLQSKAKDIIADYYYKVRTKRGDYATIFSAPASSFSYYGHNCGIASSISRSSMEQLDCFVDDILVISCDIDVLTEPSIAQSHPDGWRNHIEKLFYKGQRFDVTFEVEGESIPANRQILATSSPVFEALLFGSMAEAKLERINIDYMKPVVFKALLRFVYIDQLVLQPLYGDDNDKTFSVDLLQDLFVAADRYALNELTVLCAEQLANKLTVDTVMTTLLLADQHSNAALKKKCLDFTCDPEIFHLIAVTDGYLRLTFEAPLLFAELAEKVKSAHHSAKKQRSG